MLIDRKIVLRVNEISVHFFVNWKHLLSENYFPKLLQITQQMFPKVYLVQLEGILFESEAKIVTRYLRLPVLIDLSKGFFSGLSL